MRNSCFGALIALLVLMAACGNSNLYVADAVEESLVESQQDRLGDLQVGGATCPDDVALTEGVTFTCTLDLEGADAPYAVKLTDVQAEEIAVSAEPAMSIIPVAAAAEYVQDNLAEDVSDADVVCGDDDAVVILAEPGDEFSCTVSIGSQSRQVDLEVTDTDGAVAFLD